MNPRPCPHELPEPHTIMKDTIKAIAEIPASMKGYSQDEVLNYLQLYTEAMMDILTLMDNITAELTYRSCQNPECNISYTQTRLEHMHKALTKFHNTVKKNLRDRLVLARDEMLKNKA